MPELFDDDGGQDEDDQDNVASEESAAHDQQRLERERALRRDHTLVELVRDAGWMSEAYQGLAVAQDEMITGALTQQRRAKTLHLAVRSTLSLDLGPDQADDYMVQKLILEASALTVCHFALVYVLNGAWTPQGGLLLYESLLQLGLLMYAERYLAALAFGGASPPPSLDLLTPQLDGELYLLLRPGPDWNSLL